MAARGLSPTSSFKSGNGPVPDVPLHDIHASLAVPGPGIRLLTFDDGGIRGLSELLLLRKILLRVQQGSGLPSLPAPYEYFDIIAGSGTGGFIALLLGRLRVTIEEAIECYARLVTQVFTQIKSDGSFKATSLEKVMRELCHRFGESEEMSILDDIPAPCKAFVCTREQDATGHVTHRRLRTYLHPGETAFQCTVVEAVRATMGQALFFKPLSIGKGDASITYLDAGYDHYNPVFDILEETRLLYPSRHMAYCLSLGAGKANTVGENGPRRFINQPRLPPATLVALRHLAERCDTIASAFEAQHGAEFDDKYFRLTPAHPSYDGRIRWEQVDPLEAFVAPYVESVYNQIETVAIAMMEERDLITASSRKKFNRQFRDWR
ncbi:FabD/lysophospholipase-like protein [Schizophyllum commune H4-8]|uniref:Expressed protein n=1 Tax=Schizophyllum commune (strain H4-8 / FGSC 9210) TaxID=578458 RepID=D8PUT8_SCHCM|nr:FabD/lysophospholipase-like protein [Schizophyllum commune H4-8]KAI5900622.1 FabD/lysophospholipase-like protein [Schizophyllum commune H4-8]